MRDEDNITTMQMSRIPWLPPVQRKEDLPDDDSVPEGCLCLVEKSGEGEDEIWEFTSGAWRLNSAL